MVCGITGCIGMETKLIVKPMHTYAILCTWDFTKHFQSFKLFAILRKRMLSKLVNEKLLFCDFKVKVRTFWETHKIWKNHLYGFDLSADILSKHQNHEEDFFKLCVLLKKSELYKKDLSLFSISWNKIDHNLLEISLNE